MIGSTVFFYKGRSLLDSRDIVTGQTQKSILYVMSKNTQLYNKSITVMSFKNSVVVYYQNKFIFRIATDWLELNPKWRILKRPNVREMFLGNWTTLWHWVAERRSAGEKCLGKYLGTSIFAVFTLLSLLNRTRHFTVIHPSDY